MDAMGADPCEFGSEPWLRAHLSFALLQRAAAMNVVAARKALSLPPLYEPLPEWKLKNLKEAAMPTKDLDPIPGDPCPACWRGPLNDIVPPVDAGYSPNLNDDDLLINFTVQCPECQWLMNGRTHRREAAYGPRMRYERTLTTEQPVLIRELPPPTPDVNPAPFRLSTPPSAPPSSREASFETPKIIELLNTAGDWQPSLSTVGTFAMLLGVLASLYLLLLRVPFLVALLPLVLLGVPGSCFVFWATFGENILSGLRKFWSRATQPAPVDSAKGNSARSIVLIVSGLLFASSIWAAARLYFHGATNLALAALVIASVSGLVLLRFLRA